VRRSLHGIFVLFALVAACEESQRQDASLVVELVERYRLGDAGGLSGATSALRALPCSHADVCEAKRACLAFLEPLERRWALQGALEAEMVGLELRKEAGVLRSDDPALAAVRAATGEAAEREAEAIAARRACEAKVFALRRKYPR
jgi:hypothetical protein